MKINTAILLLAIIRNRVLLICCFATTVIHVLSRTAVARLPVRLLGYCVTFVCNTVERKHYIVDAFKANPFSVRSLSPTNTITDNNLTVVGLYTLSCEVCILHLR